MTHQNLSWEVLKTALSHLKIILKTFLTLAAIATTVHAVD